MNNNDLNTSMPISIEQSKLLGNAKRVKIISCLLHSAKTAKQVADELGQSPGSIHYHICKLHEGGLLDLVETKQEGGIVEKYYLAKAKWFDSEGRNFNDPVLAEEQAAATQTLMRLRLFLTPAQQEELTNEFKTMLENWVEKTSDSAEEQVREFAVGIKLVSVD